MNDDEIISMWEKFSEGKEFTLNPDQEFVGRLAAGVLDNEQKKGFRYCPCRISDGSYEQNVGLLCPCNFRTHTTWDGKGRCWCGLFVKKEKEESR